MHGHFLLPPSQQATLLQRLNERSVSDNRHAGAQSRELRGLRKSVEGAQRKVSVSTDMPLQFEL